MHLIDRDYRLIRRFKTTTLRSWFLGRFNQKNEVFLQIQWILWSEIKRLWYNNEKSSKKQQLGINDVSRNKSISSKRATRGLIYVVTIQIFRSGKVLVITVQRINLKRLYTAFSYNFDLLMTVDIKGLFLRYQNLVLKSRNNEPEKKNWVKYMNQHKYLYRVQAKSKIKGK